MEELSKLHRLDESLESALHHVQLALISREDLISASEYEGEDEVVISQKAFDHDKVNLDKALEKLKNLI